MINKSIIQGKSFFILILVAGLYFPAPVTAGGISADAGLTPAQDKWIFRSQVRFFQRSDNLNPAQKEMKSYMFPVVVAYGLRSDITLMVRQIYARMDMTTGSMTTSQSGLADLFVMIKYRAYRYNSRDYTIGVAPFLGFEFPTGERPFTSDGTDLKAGLFISGRRSPWAIELNLTYKWNGLFGNRDKIVENEELELISAFAYQIDLGSNAQTALAPVIEISYNHNSPDEISGETQANSGDSNFRLSPGIKFTYSSFIIESLIMIPVWQEQKGKQLESKTGVLLGIRFFF